VAVLIVVLLISVVFSVYAVSLVIRISHQKKWYDDINDKKIHSGNIPRLGGIGFGSAFFILIHFLNRSVIKKNPELIAGNYPSPASN